jgi:hypothetical protein
MWIVDFFPLEISYWPVSCELEFSSLQRAPFLSSQASCIAARRRFSPLQKGFFSLLQRNPAHMTQAIGYQQQNNNKAKARPPYLPATRVKSLFCCHYHPLRFKMMRIIIISSIEKTTNLAMPNP